MRTIKILLLPLLFLASNANASSADKDILRDACAAVKPANKKSACFDALERLTPQAVVAASPAAPKTAGADRKLKPSLRGIQCEAVEFSELDAMPADELEGLYCSYDLGSKMSETVNKRMMAKNEGNLKVQQVLLQSHIATLERCMRGTTKAGDAFRRKFPDLKTDCTKMPKIKEPEDTSDFGRPAQ
nr:hypothetical protein [uncultured Duganella sp.]